MDITVVGATGGTGRALLTRLATTDHNVTVLARRPHAVPAGPWRVVQGDATDPAAMRSVVAGADAVVVLVGAAAGQPVGTVRSAATRTVISAVAVPAVGAQGGSATTTAAPHLVVVSALGGAGSMSQLSWFGRMIYRRVVGEERLAEVTRQEELLLAAGLDTTVVRPPKLDDAAPTGPREVTSRVKAAATLHRDDLAEHLLGALTRRPHGVEAVTVISA